MTVHRIRPEVVAHTTCPNGHTDEIEAIDPVFVGGQFEGAAWSSAFHFCMECEGPVSAVVEVRR